MELEYYCKVCWPVRWLRNARQYDKTVLPHVEYNALCGTTNLKVPGAITLFPLCSKHTSITRWLHGGLLNLKYCHVWGYPGLKSKLYWSKSAEAFDDLVKLIILVQTSAPPDMIVQFKCIQGRMTEENIIRKMNHEFKKSSNKECNQHLLIPDLFNNSHPLYDKDGNSLQKRDDS